MAEYLSKVQRNWRGVRVLVRVDFNVTIKEGKIQDFSRIDAFCQCQTMSHLMQAGAKVMLLAHLGRHEEGKACQSSEILCQPLEQRLGCPIGFVDAVVGEEVAANIARMMPGSVLLLGNSRFSAGDEGNSEELAEELAKLCDVFVFDGFGVAHREQASTTGVMARRESYLGYLVEQEIAQLTPFTGQRDKSVAVIGGKKLKEKVGVIGGLLANGWQLILGGVPLNVALKVSGRHIGCSLDNEAGKSYDDKMAALLAKYPKQIHLPGEVVIGECLDPSCYKAWDPATPLPTGWEIVDCVPGEGAIDLLATSSRIILAGPLGQFELGHGAGTKAVTDLMQRHPCSLVLGGDTAAATGFKNFSTGGGSAIFYLSNGTLPVLG